MAAEKRFDLEIERAILGDCLINSSSLEQLLLNGVVKKDFYNPNHQEIYEAFINTYSKHRAIDIVLVANENKGISISYLAELLSGAISINLKAHISILMNMAINREYFQLAKEVQEGEIEDLGAYIKSQAEKIESLKSRMNFDNTLITLDKVKLINIHEVEKIRTGFSQIDNNILGFIMGSLNVITGYNGNGKSTLINQMCIAESISQGYKVFAFSPELTNSNLKSWLYPTLAIDEHFVTRDYYGRKYRVIGDIGIKFIDKWLCNKFYTYTDDSITNSGKQLLKDMEYMAMAKGVRVFVIDNLMKIEIEESYNNELLAQKNFVNKLKEFARKYNSIVHLVVHPRKPQQGSENRINKFDIAGTGDITNLADYVMAIKRVTDEERKKDQRSKNPLGVKDCIIKVMKDRPKGSSEFYVNLSFNRDRRRFYFSDSELNKEYGYTKGIELMEVEQGSFIFD